MPGSATTDGNPVNFTGTCHAKHEPELDDQCGKTGTIDVQNGTAAPTTTVLTMSGASADTSGSLIKTGPGTCDYGREFAEREHDRKR